MKFLLDENFPLQLAQSLVERGHECDHIIALGMRGISDKEIAEILAQEDCIFLTNDSDFIALLPATGSSKIIISEVRQSLSLDDRLAIWCKALETFEANAPDERLFKLHEDSTVIAV